MQDHFLFDDDDPKQRGKGCDALCRQDPRLKFDWKWMDHSARGKGVPCQISEAKLRDGWTLRAIFWHTQYEASVERHRETVANFETHFDYEPEKRLLTRLDAQLKSEELFHQTGLNILMLYSFPDKKDEQYDETDKVDNLATDRWGGAGPDCPLVLG